MYFIFFFGALMIASKYVYDNKINIAYKIIKTYTCIQQYLYPHKKKVITYHSEPFEYVTHDSTIVEHNEIQEKTDAYNMMVYTDEINKLCFYFSTVTDPSNLHLTYELSKVLFVSFNINYNHINYPIQLSTPEYNFYIVNNVINLSWIKYYFKKYLNIVIKNPDKIFHIHFIDENINFIQLTKDDSIKFEKDSYTIINNNQ